MKRVKSIFQWLVGIVVGLYLAITLLINIPLVQRLLADGIESLLEDVIKSRVDIGKVSLSWNGRIILDDLHVEDKQKEELLSVTRVGARIDFGNLIHRRVRIGNAQLFGLHANLYQENEGEVPNFKFLIDAFASKDTSKHTPLDLRISQILIRRGNISWHQRWKPQNTSFSPAHVDFSNINLTAQLNVLTDDSLNLRVKRVDLEERCGLSVKSLSFNLVGNRNSAELSDFALALPHSTLSIPKFVIHDYRQSIKQVTYKGSIEAQFTPQDLSLFLPKFNNIEKRGNIIAIIDGSPSHANIRLLQIKDDTGQLRLTAMGNIDNPYDEEQRLVHINLHEFHLKTEALLPYIDHAILHRINIVDMQGSVKYAQERIDGNLHTHTPLGDIQIQGNAQKDGDIDLHLSSPGFLVGKLMDHADLGTIALNMKAKGKVNSTPHIRFNGTIPRIDYRQYTYRNIEVDGKINGKRYEGHLISGDPNALFDATAEIDLQSNTYLLNANINNLSPNLLNFTKGYETKQFSGQIHADISGAKTHDMTGIVHINQFSISDSLGVYSPGDVHITSRLSGNEHQIMLISPFLEAQINGRFDLKRITKQIKRMVSIYLPSSPLQQYVENNDSEHESSQSKYNELEEATSFTLRAYNTELLQRLFGIPLILNGTTIAHGKLDNNKNALWMNLKSPYLQYGNESLRDIDISLESNYESLLAKIEMQRQMKGKWVNIGMDTKGNDGLLTTRLYFNNKTNRDSPETKTYAGDISIVSRIWNDTNGRQAIDAEILPSNLIISDTLWSIHPGAFSYHDHTLKIDSFMVSQGNRYIQVEGSASKSESDTLNVRLQRINLEYIFSLINFHAVELTGEATGTAYAHSLFATPKANAYIRIPQFALNYGTLGDLDIHVNWGDRPYSIYLDGQILDGGWNENNGEKNMTYVKGYITPKKDVDYHGIDLNVNAQRVNMEFINKWTSGIFDNLQGRATGWVHIFGPFKQINIEGDAVVDEGSLGVPFIGVRYHLEGDSVQLRPDNIYFTNAHLYDPKGNPGIEGHQALVTGHLHHNSFKNMSYDILLRGDNILGYDFQEFGDQNFYGTVYATGDVSIKGHPGQIRIGIKAHPERGTAFTYNATSPDRLTETPFITYKEGGPLNLLSNTRLQENASITSSEVQGGSDMYLDFDLDIDEQSTMNLLMDTRSGDKISLNGSGHMLANYYNKGSFELFGTYRVNRGTYNMSLQEVIHKNFEFSPEGTITFNGEPYEADLNLQAVHTVAGVSLNDINPKANFSNTTTRVNCLMNIDGKARAPRITFDFDIPNANEEEKQMVRSLISTEEERNMQVIYLLGIGRFYNYDYVAEQAQGTTAMNSLLSSTISSTINQALSSIMGKTNWNFGANLRTGEDKWNDIDVEGMLQGSLLNNRLLINGNFGYRDTPVANSNFIGDFDVKYLLTRSGSVALKAYSETNDRYFTKSSLTTQGIGVLLKKDFTSCRDLMTIKKKKNKKKLKTKER